LLTNPEKLESLLKEVNHVFPSKDDVVTFAKTQDMPYLNGVINEALRLMPVVVSGLDRVAEATTTISGYEIPEGVNISLPSIPHPSIFADIVSDRSLSLGKCHDVLLHVLAFRQILPARALAPFFKPSTRQEGFPSLLQRYSELSRATIRTEGAASLDSEFADGV
jgi:hypothetical protein